MTRIGFLLILFLPWQIATSNSFASEEPIPFDKPIEGRIVDARSGKPLGGVIVIALWEGRYTVPSFGHSRTETVCYETALTENNASGSYRFGRTNIIPPPNHHTRYVRLLAYKSGYWPVVIKSRPEPEPPVSEQLKRGPPYGRIELSSAQIFLEPFPATKPDRLKYLSYLSARAYAYYPKCVYRIDLREARYRFDHVLYAEAVSLTDSFEDRNIAVSLGNTTARSYLNGDVPSVLTFLDRKDALTRMPGVIVFDDDPRLPPVTTLTREQIDHVLAGRLNPLQTYTELKRAIVQRDVAAGRSYLAKGVDVNFVDGYRYPLLRHAVHSNNREIILMLLQHGASLTRGEGSEALHWAALNNDTEVAGFLLDRGVGANSAGIDDFPVLHAAAYKGSADVARLFLQRGADLSLPHRDSNSVMETALEHNQARIVQVLLDHKASPNTKDRRGYPLVMNALYTQKYEIAKVLLKGGADPNMQDPRGHTPLEVAAEKGAMEIAELLIHKGGDINAKDGSALGRACYHGQEAMVEFLLKNKARTDGEYGRRAMRLTLSYKGTAAIAQMLLDRGAKVDAETFVDMIHTTPEPTLKLLLDRGANANLARPDGSTALMVAAAAGQENIVAMLLEHGADIHMRNNDGRTALMQAAQAGRGEIVRHLVAKGSEVNAKDNLGHTALMLAIDYGNTPLLADPESHQTPPAPVPKARITATPGKKLQTSVIELEAGLNRKTYSEKPIRIQGVGGGSSSVAIVGPRPQPSPREWRRTILPAPGLVYLLLIEGADPKLRDSVYGWTALMRAAAIDFPDIVRMLLEAGTDTDTKDFRGRTARDMAMKYGNNETVTILDSHGANRSSR